MMAKLGIYSLLAGLFVGVFSGISQFMENKNFWVDLTISKIIGEDNSKTIVELIDVAFIQNSFDFLIYDLPFFCFLLGLSGIFLVISLFVKSH
ncbi:MAG: hypothetical protein K8S18_03425 [Desulfobacula sp.]|nr:hypothetical protein [Desulfobacula sp.]